MTNPTLQPYPQKVTIDNLLDVVSQICRIRATDVTAWNNLNNIFVSAQPDSGGVGPGVASLNDYAKSVNPSFSGTVNIASLTASELVATDASKNLVSVTALPSGTTAVTQALGDSSTKVGTTFFANPSTSNAANGSVTLPGGTIIKWGVGTSSGTSAGNGTITFPTPFPTGFYSATCTVVSNSVFFVSYTAATVNGIPFSTYNTSVFVSGVTFTWIAIGH